MALALAPHGIAVTTIAPGFVATDRAAALNGPEGAAVRAQSPFDRVATPHEWLPPSSRSRTRWPNGPAGPSSTSMAPATCGEGQEASLTFGMISLTRRFMSSRVLATDTSAKGGHSIGIVSPAS
jgi:hypothetical protein